MGARRGSIVTAPPGSWRFPFACLLDTAPCSAEDFAASTPGFPRVGASLLHNEKRKPQLAGREGGRSCRVAAALNLQQPRGLSPGGADPDLNFQRDSGVGEPAAAPTRPPTPARGPPAPTAPRAFL